jgi:hypothetical protein
MPFAFQVCCVFTNRSLVTVANNGDCSASGFQILSSQTPVPLLIISRHGPHRKRRFYITAFVSVAAGTCFPSHCTEMATERTTESTVSILFCVLRALTSNGCCLQIHLLSKGLYATIPSYVTFPLSPHVQVAYHSANLRMLETLGYNNIACFCHISVCKLLPSLLTYWLTFQNSSTFRYLFLSVCCLSHSSAPGSAVLWTLLL